MLVLYPELKPYQRHSLKVSELHELYIDEAGDPDGVPVLSIHGGPGSGCDASSRRFYDPAFYRIVTFDQRGCGRSTPHGELSDKTLIVKQRRYFVELRSAIKDSIDSGKTLEEIKGTIDLPFYKKWAGVDVKTRVENIEHVYQELGGK